METQRRKADEREEGGTMGASFGALPPCLLVLSLVSETCVGRGGGRVRATVGRKEGGWLVGEGGRGAV